MEAQIPVATSSLFFRKKVRPGAIQDFEEYQE